MPKSASPKKTTGTPKAKGAVRAKSGCYTCRIRRKKCDERADDLGRCETCVRLRLQCLGFGAKRPEWLRENNNVTDLREKIKNFLASQGMIKGHSGTGSRSAEQEQTLRLADENYHTPSESPQSNILVLDEESPRGTMSNMREHREPGHEHEPELYSGTSYGASSSTSYDLSPSQSIFSHSPSSNHFLRLSTPTYGHPHHQDSIEGYPSDYYLTSNHTNLVVPWTNPTRHSTFGTSYHLPLDALDVFDDDLYSPFDLNLSIDDTDSLLQHYVQTVYRHQYQLADMTKLPKIIFQSIMEGGAASNAAVLLADIHAKKLQNERFLLVRDGPSKRRYDELVQLFRPSSQQRVYSESDAMAALHVISAFLFDGGRGEWQMWMQVAYWYCRSILEDRQRFRDYRDALVSCTVQQNFIIKTFFWFDVLASVSTMRPPLFKNVLNEIYNPVEQVGRIEDPADIYTEPALSMMTFMGCENRIVWALSEISALAFWKRTQEGIGKLSVVELVRRATILHDSLEPSMDLSRQQQQTAGLSVSSENAEPGEPARYLASEIFRTAAIAYLQTIVNNDFYEVPEVQQAVKDCVEAFKSFMDYKTDVRHIVVRSTVFAVFLCGCFTDVPGDWDALETHLKEEGDMGNCKGVMELIQEVRAERGQPKPHPVMWRQALERAKMLLV